jgi:hypothetical protein
MPKPGHRGTVLVQILTTNVARLLSIRPDKNRQVYIALRV